MLDKLFDPQGSVTSLLEQKILSLESGTRYTCLDLNKEINHDLREFDRAKSGKLPTAHITNWGASLDVSQRYDDKYLNLFASNALVNHYLEDGLLGIHRGSETPGAAVNVFQFLNRLFSWDGFLSILGQSDKHGASQAANKAQEFSELLQRAPHIKGFAKMMLIAAFPWLVFFIIAGRWKILVFWTALYGSTLLWEPIWTLCYHIITHIAISAEAISSFDRLADGFSLYSAQLISSRMYYAYSIYSWVQILVGPLPTILLAINMRSLLASAQEESSPVFVNEVKSYAAPSSAQPQQNPRKSTSN